MKIAFLGNFEVDYSSETHHLKTLEAMGHEVTPLQERIAPTNEVLSVAQSSDVFVWVHTHGWKQPGSLTMKNVLDALKDKGVPSLTYHLDLWFGLQRQADMQSDDYWNIEYFFTVDKLMADWFNKETDIKGHYIRPACYDLECYPAFRYEKFTPNNNVIFVGSRGYHPEWKYRPQLINWLEENYRNQFTHYGGDGPGGLKRGHDLNLLYASSKVAVGDTLCLNFDYPYYWSDRIYETIGRGGFIIHPYIVGMEEEFIDGEHLRFYEYGNFDQLKELIDFYVKNDKEREEIRIRGQVHVMKNLTYRHRWNEILEIVT